MVSRHRSPLKSYNGSLLRFDQRRRLDLGCNAADQVSVGSGEGLGAKMIGLMLVRPALPSDADGCVGVLALLPEYFTPSTHNDVRHGIGHPPRSIPHNRCRALARCCSLRPWTNYEQQALQLSR